MSGIPSWARVGAKVVCIGDGGGPARWTDFDGPTKGHVYTISRVLLNLDVMAVYVHLVEIARGPTARLWWGDDVGYDINRFRPLITQQDDIEAHFKALLDVSDKVAA